MTKRHPNEVLVARWHVGPDPLRAFIRQMRDRYGDTPFTPNDLLNECETHARTGLEIVCRDDAIFVGRWCLAFLYNQVTDMTVQDMWIRCEMEGGLYEIPIPITLEARAEAVGVVKHYARLAEEETRQAVARRQAPTWSNYFLNIAEAHPVWLLLAFFFVGIPAIVLLVGLLRGGFQ